MKINNKKYFNLFNQSGPFELELGCGNNKRNEQAIGIDILDADGIDIVGDVYEVLAQFPDQSINAVYGYHFLEHIPDVPKLLAELARIMNSNGHLEWVVPHFSNPYFYSDPTHRSFFGLYTFCYYAGGSYFSRKVPTYANTPGFRISKVDLVFKSDRSFPFRYGFKKVIGSIFNSCSYMQEFYEENFCYLIPCYEVRYKLYRER